MSRHEEDEEETSDSKGAYKSPTISNTVSSTGIYFLKPPKLRRWQSRSVSSPDPVSLRKTSKNTVHDSQCISSRMTRGSVPEGPASTDCEELTSGFNALSLGKHAVEIRSRVGSGCTTGEDPVASFSEFLSSCPPPATPVVQGNMPSQSVISKASKNIPRQKQPPPSPFLRRDTNDRVPVFDPETRMQTIEREFAVFKQKMEGETSQASDLKETIKVLQSRGRNRGLSSNVTLSSNFSPPSHRVGVHPFTSYGIERRAQIGFEGC